MYPSKCYPSFGVFVKNFINSLSNDHKVSFVLSVIKGKHTSFLKKILVYMHHYFEIVYNGLTTHYDLLYLHYISHSALPVLLVKLLTGKSLVINAHGSDVLSDNKILKINSYFIKKLVLISDCIVVPSKYYKEVMIKKYNIDKSKFFISPSGGVNRSLFAPIEKKNNKNELVIGYVSRIDPGKGWDIFLDAFLKIKQKINVRAIIVGDGIDREKLLNKIKSNGINHLVQLYALVPQKELPKIFNQLDVFIFPTTRFAESLGLVGLEAMSCGIPVIGSEIGGPSEYIKNNINGYKFAPGDFNDLVIKIKMFYNLLEDDLQEMKKHSIETAKKYDNKLVTKKIFKKLKSIC